MSLINVFRNGDPLLIFAVVFSRMFVVFCCLPFHEVAHGWMAYKMGDSTAKNFGRLSLNPFKHLDLVGTIMIFLFGIGYANPVPVNARNFKNPKKGMALTALAGPVSNLLLAFVSVCFYYILLLFPESTLLLYITMFFKYAAMVNVSLAVFNLFPIPPLDGSKIFAILIPSKIYFRYMKYERYAMIALIVLLFTGLLDTPIGYITSFFMKIISFIPNLLFNLIA
ncbi:MAG: site-2 protease family protein [Eubacterium sp.]